MYNVKGLNLPPFQSFLSMELLDSGSSKILHAFLIFLFALSILLVGICCIIVRYSWESLNIPESIPREDLNRVNSGFLAPSLVWYEIRVENTDIFSNKFLSGSVTAHWNLLYLRKIKLQVEYFEISRASSWILENYLEFLRLGCSFGMAFGGLQGKIQMNDKR
jgi:hypothetical protein